MGALSMLTGERENSEETFQCAGRTPYGCTRIIDGAHGNGELS
jgi:hypothetical protein